MLSASHYCCSAAVLIRGPSETALTSSISTILLETQLAPAHAASAANAIAIRAQMERHVQLQRNAAPTGSTSKLGSVDVLAMGWHMHGTPMHGLWKVPGTTKSFAPVVSDPFAVATASSSSNWLHELCTAPLFTALTPELHAWGEGFLVLRMSRGPCSKHT